MIVSPAYLAGTTITLVVTYGQDPAKAKSSAPWKSKLGKPAYTFEAVLRTEEIRLIPTEETPGPVEQSSYPAVDAFLIGQRAIQRSKVVESESAHVGTASDKHYFISFIIISVCMFLTACFSTHSGPICFSNGF